MQRFGRILGRVGQNQSDSEAVGQQSGQQIKQSVMTQEELLNRVRKIEIKARGLSRNIFAGEYHSQFKGRGMAFSGVREYQPGDDVRSIDWNVTARLNKPYIKVFEE